MKIPLLLSILLAISSAANAASNNWQSVLAQDPISGNTGCLLISASKQSEDGQSGTPVQIIYNGRIFMIKTESNIDLSYPGIGLQVDNNKAFNIDRLHKKTNVVFESQAEIIRGEFISGISARLTLGFWPSWPVTKAYQSRFSLRGFTRAHQAFRDCQEAEGV